MSKWSPGNKKRVEELTQSRRMTKAGLALVEAAKANGCWDRLDRPDVVTKTPDELRRALNGNATARAFFDGLPPGHRRQYIMWIATAKKPDTRLRRAEEAIRLLGRIETLGLR